jgi:hypothetical protein
MQKEQSKQQKPDFDWLLARAHWAQARGWCWSTRALGTGARLRQQVAVTTGDLEEDLTFSQRQAEPIEDSDSHRLLHGGAKAKVHGNGGVVPPLRAAKEDPCLLLICQPEGRNVGLISPPMGPTAHWALDSRPDRGRPAR